MLAIPAEQLVGALARQRHRHFTARELAERQEAQRGQVGERLVEVPDELLQIDATVVQLQLQLVVLGAEPDDT